MTETEADRQTEMRQIDKQTDKENDTYRVV